MIFYFAFIDCGRLAPILRRAAISAGVILVALGGLCFEALGADWHVSGRDAAGREWSIDTDSLGDEDDYLHAWVKIVYGSPQLVPGSEETYVDEVDNLAIDCEKRRYAVTIAHRRNEYGRVVATHIARPDQWEFMEAAPESIGLRVLEDACAFWERAVAEEARRLKEYLENDDWRLAMISEDRTVSAYVNIATATRYEEVVSALVQYRYQKPVLVRDKAVKYLLVLEFFNCSESLRYFGGSMAVDANGKALGKYHAASPDDVIEQPVLPDTLGAGVLDLLCGDQSAQADETRNPRISAARTQADAGGRSSSM